MVVVVAVVVAAVNDNHHLHLHLQLHLPKSGKSPYPFVVDVVVRLLAIERVLPFHAIVFDRPIVPNWYKSFSFHQNMLTFFFSDKVKQQHNTLSINKPTWSPWYTWAMFVP